MHEGQIHAAELFDGTNRIAESCAERVRAAVDAGGGHKRVAEATGINTRTLSYLLAGQEMKQGQLVALAKACNVHLEWLATGEGPMRPGDPPPAPLQAAENPAKPLRLFAFVQMDTLASAYSAALHALASRGIDDAPPRRVMQLTTEIYDLLRHEEEAQNPKD